MNDDTISRQRLLKELKHHKELFSRNRIEFLGLSKNDKARVDEIDNCIATVINMPPAQPEIVRCGQCKYAEVADAQDNQDGYTCQFHRGSIWFSGSYCSWGERRIDEGSD